ncbi:MAG: histidinol-phosphate transaminase, partial [Pseudomonadota bacterium]
MNKSPTQILSPLDVRGRISRPQPKGLPVIGMGFNELPFGPTPKVAEAIAALTPNVHRYGNPTCVELRTAIGAQYGLDPDAIVCGNGSEELLDVIARSFVAPGDEIVISEYGYIQFPMIANRLRARLTKAPERGFTTDVDAMLSCISGSTAIAFLANPNNPTGTFIPVEEIERLIAETPTHVPLVIDLAYGEFVGAAYCTAMHDLVQANANVIVTCTFSKAFGLAGLRVGWLHAPKEMLPGFYTARG